MRKTMRKAMSMLLALTFILSFMPALPALADPVTEIQWDVVQKIDVDFNATTYPAVADLPWAARDGWSGNPAGVKMDFLSSGSASWSGGRVGRYNATANPRGGQSDFHVPVQSEYRVTMDFDWYPGSPSGSTNTSYGKLAIQNTAEASFSNSGGQPDNQFINLFSSSVSGSAGLYYVIGNALDSSEYRVNGSAGSTRSLPFSDVAGGTKIKFADNRTIWYKVSLDLDFVAKTMKLTIKESVSGDVKVDGVSYPFPYQSPTDLNDRPFVYSTESNGIPITRSPDPVEYLNQIASFRFFNAGNWTTQIDNVLVQAHIPFAAPVLSGFANGNAAKGTVDVTVAPYSVPDFADINDVSFNLYAKTDDGASTFIKNVPAAGTYTLNLPRGNHTHIITAEAVIGETITNLSAPLTVLLDGVTDPKPALVTAVNFTPAKGQIGLSWDAVQWADEYVIYRAFFATSAFEKVATVSATSYTDVNAKLTDTASTYYKIEAIGNAGSDGLSQAFASPSNYTLVPRSGKDRALTAVNLGGNKGAEILVSATGPDGVELTSGVYLSWRWFGADDTNNTTFTLYKNNAVIQTGLTVTNLVDPTGTMYDIYRVVGSSDVAQGIVAGDVRVWTDFYQELQLYKPAEQKMMDGSRANYATNDMTVADLDGDGTLELIVKWYPSNAKDTSVAGQTGTTIYDAYKINWGSGEASLMWRVDLGWGMRSGAHYAQFGAADFAGLGYAQFATSSVNGTMSWHSLDGTDNTLVANPGVVGTGLPSAPITGSNAGGSTHVTMFDGKTGAIIGSVARAYTDSAGRNNACVGYLHGRGEGARPSFIMGGQYGSMRIAEYYINDSGAVVVGMTYDAGGAANHNMHAIDLNGDGIDEIILGASIFEVNAAGTSIVRRSTTGVHGDAMHISNYIYDPINYPDINGTPRQFIVLAQENPGSGTNSYSSMARDALTGNVLVGWNGSPNHDTGRAMAGDVDPTSKNAEMWAANGPRQTPGGNWDMRIGGLYGMENYGIMRANASNDTGNLTKLADLSPSMNFSILWDGDLLTEMQDHEFSEQVGYFPISTNITKWDYINGVEFPLFYSKEVFTINGTKGNPNLIADILGDWREEAIFRDAKDNSKVRVYMSTIQTDYVIPHLMEDNQYANMVQSQQSAYNQPSTTSYMPSSRAITARELDYSTVSSTGGVTMRYTPANDGQYGFAITGHQLWRKAGGIGTFDLTPAGTLSDSTKAQLTAAGYTKIAEVAGSAALLDSTAVVGQEYSYVVIGVAGSKLSYLGRPVTFTIEDRSAPVTGVTVAPKTANLIAKDATVQLNASVLPANAQDKNVVWTSSNEKVAVVDENGLVTAVGNGTANITATSVNGISDSAAVTVAIPTYAVTFMLDETEVYVTKNVYRNLAIGDEIALNPYKAGYNFAGWFTALEDGEAFTSDTVVAGNITVYARFKANTTTAKAGDRWQFNFRQGSQANPEGWIDMRLSANNTWAATTPKYSSPATVDNVQYGVYDIEVALSSRDGGTAAGTWYQLNPDGLTGADRFGNTITAPRAIGSSWATQFGFAMNVPNGAYDVIIVLGNGAGGASRGGLNVHGEPRVNEVLTSSNPATLTTVMVSREVAVPEGTHNSTPRTNHVILSHADNIMVKDGYLGIETGGGNFNVCGYIVVVYAIHAGLEEAISNAGKLVEADYPAAKWEVLQAAVAAGQAAINKGGSNGNDAYNQTEIDAFAKAINDAIAALDSTPAVSSFTVNPGTFVENNAAGLGYAIEGVNLEDAVMSLELDGKYYHVDALTGIIRINKMPAAGSYDVKLWLGDSVVKTFTIRVVELPADIWSFRFADLGEGKLQLQFNAEIAATTKGIVVKVNGEIIESAIEGLNAVAVTYTPKAGDTFVVSGIKFPVLYPSYSFTFTQIVK